MSLLKVESKPKNSTLTVTRPLLNATVGLWTAVLVSFTLHLLVFYFWTNTETEHLSLGQQHFTASIVASEVPAHIEQEKSVKPQQKQFTKANPAANKTPKQNDKTAYQQHFAKQKSAPDIKESKNAVLGNIQSRLSQYLSYPELARRKSWQGIVVISLIVNDSGNFSDVHINSSSGFFILDNTALEAVQELGAIDVVEEFRLALNTTLQIPVHFKLKGT